MICPHHLVAQVNHQTALRGIHNPIQSDADGGLHCDSPHRPDAVHEGTQIADVERAFRAFLGCAGAQSSADHLDSWLAKAEDS